VHRAQIALLALCLAAGVLAGCRREAPTPPASADVGQRPYRPGETVRFAQAAITLLEAQRDGQRLTVRLRAEAAHDISLRQQYDFELRDSQGRYGTPALVGVPHPPFDGRVASGERLEGYLGFDLPPDMSDLGTMELTYRPTFARDTTVTFRLQ
jgi:hypothetical protein